jgi:alginate O-acetyltransferase complex protein AlgI
MAFDSLEYVALLVGTLVLFANLRARGRLVLLIAASILFYAVWSVPFVGLIVVSAIIDFTAGVRLEGETRPRVRKLWLAFSLCTNLGLLGYFKYANFFADNVAAVLGDEWAHHVNVVLPPGISFYTFQTLSYTIDVYRGQLRPTRSFGRFFLYVSFFPQLIAGPIERAKDLLSQFGQALGQRFTWENFVSGARMIAWGMFKKVVIADSCGRVADVVYADPSGFGGWAALVGTLAFTLQIYCDFSAYSEMARGSARLFGIELMRNFDQPYLTTNIRDFWRRWHISLSNWFRDYVYLALGGNRRGRARTLANLTITMFLSGLWHGAAWNFVLWGLYHGLLLLLTTVVLGSATVRRGLARAGALGTFAGWLLAFHLVVIGWILFRVDAVADVPVVLGSIASAIVSGSGPTASQGWFLAGVYAFIAASHLERRFALFERLHRDRAASVVVYTLVIAVTVLLARGDGPQFIYFQF